MKAMTPKKTTARPSRWLNCVGLRSMAAAVPLFEVGDSRRRRRKGVDRMRQETVEREGERSIAEHWPRKSPGCVCLARGSGPVCSIRYPGTNGRQATGRSSCREEGETEMVTKERLGERVGQAYNQPWDEQDCNEAHYDPFDTGQARSRSGSGTLRSRDRCSSSSFRIFLTTCSNAGRAMIFCWGPARVGADSGRMCELHQAGTSETMEASRQARQVRQFATGDLVLKRVSVDRKSRGFPL